MAYRRFKRRKFGGRKYGRKRVWRRPRRLSRRVKRVERSVKRISSTIETKTFVLANMYNYLTTTGGQSIDSAGNTLGPLNSGSVPTWWNIPSQGVATTQRIGQSIRNTSIDLRFILHGYDNDPNQIIRLLVVKWKALPPSVLDNGPPGIDQVLQSVGSTANVQGVISPYNWSNRHLFRVLYDKTFVLSGETPGDYFGTLPRYPVKKKLKLGFNTEFLTTNQYAIRTNGIAVYGISDSISVGGHPFVEWYYRFNFQDS